MMNTTTAAIGLVSFALHFIGKWKGTTKPFWEWLWNKESMTYWVTSGLFCILALLMINEWSEPLGMKPMTYAVITCYGGGHLVSRFLGIKDAAAEKKALKS
jgi:hypothetical protein